MDLFFSKKTHQTLALIQDFIKRGIPVSDIYVEILAESMRCIGELWHSSKITVDTEHYCTSVTQMTMAQMYPTLFGSERKNKTLLCACPGSELHEMGARMVADLPIAVEGKAFESTDSIWKQWAVDIYTSDARSLLKQANKICGVG